MDKLSGCIAVGSVSKDASICPKGNLCSVAVTPVFGSKMLISCGSSALYPYVSIRLLMHFSLVGAFDFLSI